MALTDSLRDIAVNHGWPVCDEAADKIDQLERDLLGHSDYELGKNDGWEACETCHGIVDGVSPHRRAIEAEVRAEAHKPLGPASAEDKKIYDAMAENYSKEAQEPTAMVIPANIALYATPQPPAPCPNCLGQEPDDLRLRDEYIKAEREIKRLQDKIAALEAYKNLRK